jgi:hypothetical protein
MKYLNSYLNEKYLQNKIKKAKLNIWLSYKMVLCVFSQQE